MSNTYKVIIAIITVAILAAGTGILINSQNRPVDKSTSISSSSSAQSISSQSSQVKSVTSSSQIVSSAPQSIQTVVKPVPSTISQVTQDSNCDLPESENLVKTENGCFEIGFGINVFSDGSDFGNQNKPINNFQTLTLLKKIAKEYYIKNQNKILTKNESINIIGTQYVTENKFKLFLSITDPVYLKSKEYNLQSDRTRFNVIYNISFLNNQWKYEFISENIL